MISRSSNRCRQIIREILSEGILNEIGKESGLSKSVRKLTPFYTPGTFLVGLASEGLTCSQISFVCLWT